MTIQLQGVKVLNNPAPFTDEFKFQITFDCVSPGVKNELEWKLVYVGCADNEQKDQELDCILVGPVKVGKNRFTFTAPPPDPTLIPEEDLLDVTVILLTCSYEDQEFIRVGYYVHNDYPEEIANPTDPKVVIKPERIQRNILADKPRVTRFNIKWDDEPNNHQNFQSLKPIHKQNNDETKDNDEQFDDDEEEEEEFDDEEEDDDEEDQDVEEDLAETEEVDNRNNRHLNNQNNDEDTNEDDEDIDMTE